MVLYLVREIFCEGDQSLLNGDYRNRTFNDLPHLTRCAQNIDFSFIPALFVFFLSPVTLYDIYKSRNARSKSCSPITVRIGLASILLLLQTLLVTKYLIDYLSDVEDATAAFMGAAVQYLGLCVATVLLIACRNRGIVSSGVLFIYWFLLVLFGFPEFRYIISQHYSDLPDKNTLVSSVYCAFYVIVWVELILSCFADTPDSFVSQKKTCPELYSSFLNQLTFNWFTSLAILGNKKSLEQDDLWNLNDRDKADHLIPEFEHYFKPELRDYQYRKKVAEQSKSTQHNSTQLNESTPITQQKAKVEDPSILIPIFKTYKFTLGSATVYKFIFDLMQFISPELLRQLITFIQDSSQPTWIGVSISILMFLVAMLQSFILHQYFHSMFRLGMNIRSVLINAVYRKTILLSNNARKNRQTGDIVNVMSTDVQRFQDMTTYIMLFWSAPLQIILSIYYLWRLLGVAVIVGILILILMIPVNTWISFKMRKYQQQQMKYKDERLKMMSEILNGIKVLKLYAWEGSMERMVLHIREMELKVLRKLAYLTAATTLSWACAPFLVAVLTFGLYVTIDPVNNVLTPQVTFVALALFNILRFPLAICAMIISQAIQFLVSNKRMRAFFAEEEMDVTMVGNKYTADEAVNINKASFSWEGEECCLHDINLSISRGSLVAIVGRVGSGKSSLLQAILGEMNKQTGSVNVSGSISYVPQQAWIQNLTLRDNILFNRQLDSDHYNKVVAASALEQDILSLPAGDSTEIGEKGINLSGGQKQRVSLARAVYSNSDIILLDDPLSAVDAHVGKHIFENIISSETGLLSTATRILVTHGLHYLKYCDKVVVLKEGKISEMGTYKELIARQGAFSDVLEEFLVEEARNRGRSVSFGEGEQGVSEILDEIEKVNPMRRQRIQSQISQDVDAGMPNSRMLTPPPDPQPSPLHQINGDAKPIQKEEDQPAPPPPGKDGEKVALIPAGNGKPAQGKSKIIEKENIETGKVAWHVYGTYLKAIGYPVSMLFLFVYILSSILGVASNIWLARWSDDAKELQLDSFSNHETYERLGIYAVLGVGQAAFVCGASIIMALGMVGASRLLHEGILQNTLRSPMMFFDVTPLGRILNRFGKDVDAIDTTLPSSIRSMFMTIFNVVATLCVIFLATPAVFIVFVPLSVIYYLILRFYVSSSRQLKRLESATRSPVFSHFQESIQGASSIRAYKVVEKFVKESQNKVDNNLVTYYPSLVANRWLAVRLELVGNLIVLFSALFAAYYRDTPGLSAGLVGLSVSYALNITQTLNWAVRMTSELETNIVAVERIKEYTDTPTEGVLSTKKPPENWPSQGRIKFKGLSLRYREGLDLILREVTAEIHPSEKIGIVGRTGAGKSSLTLALFRIVEADAGYIEIDGENIAQMDLIELRSRLTIVPQDPVLFSGDLRLNLDPFEKHDDAEIWQALQNSYLDKFVASLPKKLAHNVSEGGENLSVGQRQLLCLARALLRKSKVLILDEAAAAVDVETDSLLQRTIREQFKHCTVLTIAHRLNTVMDSDRLLVMDKGMVAEFDTPSNLLKDKNGIFHSMAADAGLI